jgi:hypothetical protein
MNPRFPWTDFLLNVLVLAVIPGLIGLIGGLLAVKSIPSGDMSKSKKSRTQFWFLALFILYVAVTALQQYRVILADEGRPNSIVQAVTQATVQAIRQTFPNGIAQGQFPSSQPPIPQRSIDTRLANITNERLNERLKQNIIDLDSWATQWTGQKVNFFTIIKESGGPPGGFPESEQIKNRRLGRRKVAEDGFKNLPNDQRRSAQAKAILPEMLNLKYEVLTNRLHSWQLNGLPSDTVFSKLKTDNYDDDDIHQAARYMKELQKDFELVATK